MRITNTWTCVCTLCVHVIIDSEKIVRFQIRLPIGVRTNWTKTMSEFIKISVLRSQMKMYLILYAIEFNTNSVCSLCIVIWICGDCMLVHQIIFSIWTVKVQYAKREPMTHTKKKKPLLIHPRFYCEHPQKNENALNQICLYACGLLLLLLLYAVCNIVQYSNHYSSFICDTIRCVNAFNRKLPHSLVWSFWIIEIWTCTLHTLYITCPRHIVSIQNEKIKSNL